MRRTSRFVSAVAVGAAVALAPLGAAEGAQAATPAAGRGPGVHNAAPSVARAVKSVGWYNNAQLSMRRHARVKVANSNARFAYAYSTNANAWGFLKKSKRGKWRFLDNGVVGNGYPTCYKSGLARAGVPLSAQNDFVAAGICEEADYVPPTEY